MTSKDKAIELVDKFRLNVLDYNGNSINRLEAKQCALMSVDEIINANKSVWENENTYWQEVKQEIEKL